MSITFEVILKIMPEPLQAPSFHPHDLDFIESFFFSYTDRIDSPSCVLHVMCSK